MTKSECSTSQQQARYHTGQKQNNNNNNSNNNVNRRSNNKANEYTSNQHHHYTTNNNLMTVSGTSAAYPDNGSGGRHGHKSYYGYYHSHHYNSGRSTMNESSSITHLNYRQLERIRSVLEQNVEIHGRENFPTLKIPLQKFIVHVKRKIAEYDLHVKHVKLNGGAASFVLAAVDNFAYSDLDLIFPISLKTEHDFDKVRSAVFDTLLELMPEITNKEMISPETLKDIYIRKMIRVINGDHDRWSLFSLHNHYGRCIELKFVDQMKRQFEFSVDSFQITLDKLLDNLHEGRPLVQAESMYGDFCLALFHLNKRLIDTRNPEEIRGGGLLKYCHLLTRGYRATHNCREMEKYMCSRFFIDFSDISAQEAKLCAYLDNHFGNELQMKYDYLQVLYRVIKESTICLMGHERRQTLSMVEHLRNNLQQINWFTDQQQQMYYSTNGAVYYGDINSALDYAYCVGSVMPAATNAPAVIVDSAHGSPCSSPAPSPAASSVVGDAVIQPSESVVSIDLAIDAFNNASSEEYTPKQTILYLPPNSTTFEYVGVC